MFSVREDLAKSNLKPEDAGKAYWNWIAIHEELSEDDMREFADHFNWRKLSDHQKHLTESFIREFKDRVHWDRITQRIKMDEKFIEEFEDRVMWDYVWSYQRYLTPRFIENHITPITDWNRIVMYQKLDNRFIKNHIKQLGVSNVMGYQKLDKEMMDWLYNYSVNLYKDDESKLNHFLNNFAFYKMKKYQLTEEEIIDYTKNGLGWYFVVQHQKLSEEFIEKNYNKIKEDHGIYNLCRYQKLSEKFMIKHHKDMVWEAIKHNKKIKASEEFWETIKKNGWLNWFK